MPVVSGRSGKVNINKENHGTETIDREPDGSAVRTDELNGLNNPGGLGTNGRSTRVQSL